MIHSEGTEAIAAVAAEARLSDRIGATGHVVLWRRHGSDATTLSQKEKGLWRKASQPLINNVQL